MKDPEFPLEKNDGRLTGFSTRAEHRPTVYRYVESPSTEAVSPGYDSLLDYWHILFRHRKTFWKQRTPAILPGATRHLSLTWRPK